METIKAVPTDDDYDNMLHALGRPVDAFQDTYRNHFCIGAGSGLAQRFEALGWWDFRRTINDGKDAVYSVNNAGKQALALWMRAKQKERAR